MTLNDVVQYLNIGWSLIPLQGYGVDKPKAPAIKWVKYQTEKATATDVTRWIDHGRSAFGIVCGEVSGIVVIDADSPEAVLTMEQDYGITTDASNVVRTKVGGYHFYFNKPPTEIPNRVQFKPKLDVRSDGGYVVMPGSFIEPGKDYEWVSGRMPDYLPDMPGSLIADIVEAYNAEKSKMDSPLVEGERDHELTRRVGRIVRAGMSMEDTLSLAVALNNTYVNPPLAYDQVEKIVQSIHKREKGKKNVDKKTFELVPFSVMIEQYADYQEEWIIEGWLPSATCGILGSDPGMFKTWALTDLALSIATGKKFMGKYPVTRTGPVFVIQQEDPFPMLMARTGNVMNLGASVDTEDGFDVKSADSYPNIFYHKLRELRFDDEAIMDAFCEQVHKYKPVLVTIDPLYSAASTDDYMASAAKEMLKLKTLRDEVGTSFFIAHHTGKAKGEGGRSRDRLWGSQFLNAWLETGWEFEPSSTGGMSITRHFKTSENPEKTNVVFNIGSGTYEVLDDETTNESVDERVKGIIYEGKAKSLAQIAEALNIGKSTVGEIIKRVGAVKHGDIYIIPEVE